MLTGIPHLLTGLYSEEPVRKSSDVRHENILHLLMTKMMKIHMLMKKMFCYHL